MMTSGLERKLRELMDLPAETEWVEFKEAKSSFDLNDLGKYFSALSNEANLKEQVAGWLVFGVADKPPRRVVGTQYRPDRPALDQLKQEIAEGSNNGTSFDEIHEIAMPDGRVIMFEIPPAVKGIPTSWKGHFYGRKGESIGALSLNELEQIRAQTAYGDRSSVRCEDATPRPKLTRAGIDFAPGEGLSEKAKELLLEAVQDPDASVLCIRADQGLVIRTNGKQFCKAGDPRSEAEWWAVVQELMNELLLEEYGPAGEAFKVFKVTALGFRVADVLRRKE